MWQKDRMIWQRSGTVSRERKAGGRSKIGRGTVFIEHFILWRQQGYHPSGSRPTYFVFWLCDLGLSEHLPFVIADEQLQYEDSVRRLIAAWVNYCTWLKIGFHFLEAMTDITVEAIHTKSTSFSCDGNTTNILITKKNACSSIETVANWLTRNRLLLMYVNLQRLVNSCTWLK